MAEMNTFEDAFVHELGDLYSAEKQITKALPKVIKSAGSRALRQALEEHLRVTEQHVARLERCFELLGQKPARMQKCAGMEGVLGEGASLLKEDMPDKIKDAMIIGACQKVEHYEMAGYGTLCTWAEQIATKEISTLLGQTLAEEKEADQRLTELAESGVNDQAAASSSKE